MEKHTSNSDSGAGSPIHGGGKLFKVFRRKSSKSKIDIHVASQSNLSSPDRSNGDIDYNGDISSNSLFEIQVERSADINRNYNDEENFSDPQLVQRLASEVVLLRKRLDEGEQEVKKLKDEVQFFLFFFLFFFCFRVFAEYSI